jgi:hypothetical protein
MKKTIGKQSAKTLGTSTNIHATPTKKTPVWGGMSMPPKIIFTPFHIGISPSRIMWSNSDISTQEVTITYEGGIFDTIVVMEPTIQGEDKESFDQPTMSIKPGRFQSAKLGWGESVTILVAPNDTSLKALFAQLVFTVKAGASITFQSTPVDLFRNVIL